VKDSALEVYFIRLAVFDRTAKGLLTDDDERAMEQEIADAPTAAPVIPETGGVRKIRVAMKGRGKSGSARVLYLYVPKDEVVYLMVAYAKNVKETISKAEKKDLKALATQLKEK